MIAKVLVSGKKVFDIFSGLKVCSAKSATIIDNVREMICVSLGMDDMDPYDYDIPLP